MRPNECPAVTGEDGAEAELDHRRRRRRAKNSIGLFVRPQWSINQHQSSGKKAMAAQPGLPLHLLKMKFFFRVQLLNMKTRATKYQVIFQHFISSL